MPPSSQRPWPLLPAPVLADRVAAEAPEATAAAARPRLAAVPAAPAPAVLHSALAAPVKDRAALRSALAVPAPDIVVRRSVPAAPVPDTAALRSVLEAPVPVSILAPEGPALTALARRPRRLVVLRAAPAGTGMTTTGGIIPRLRRTTTIAADRPCGRSSILCGSVSSSEDKM